MDGWMVDGGWVRVVDGGWWMDGWWMDGWMDGLLKKNLGIVALQGS